MVLQKFGEYGISENGILTEKGGEMYILLWITLVIISFIVLKTLITLILGLYLIKYTEIDFLDLYKTDDLRQIVENKMVEKNILLHYSARRLAEKVPEEHFDNKQQKNEVISEIEKTIEEIGKNNSIENMPLGTLVIYGNIQEAPKELKNEINSFLKQQKKYRLMLCIFNFVDQR